MLAIHAVRRRNRRSTSAGRLHGSILRGPNPAFADGVRSALSTTRGGALLTAACCVSIATLVGAGVFGANLTTLVDRPQRYGWPWDLGVLTGGGYGGTDLDKVAADLAARREVDSYDLLGFENGTIAGKNIAMVIASSEAEPVDLPIVQGRAPRVAGEAAIGTVTADRLGLEIGDVATVDFREGQTPLKIVGTTVLPAVGQLFSDRSGLGVGAFALVPPEVMNGEIVTFVGVNLKDGADAPAVLADLEPRLIAWDTTHSVPNSYAGPIRPSEIVNAEEMQRGPLILAALLGLASIAALAISIAATVGARRRDFAIYRAIGFTRRQVASSVRWQAVTTITVGIAIGIPAGLLIGRWTWQRFAGDLGVGPEVTTPVVSLAAVALVALVIALLASARPALLASRLRPAEILHTQ